MTRHSGFHAIFPWEESSGTLDKKYSLFALKSYTYVLLIRDTLKADTSSTLKWAGIRFPE